jgi:hypothetical protein
LVVWQLVGVGTFSYTNLQYFFLTFRVAVCTCEFWVFAAVELRIPFVWDITLCEWVTAF